MNGVAESEKDAYSMPFHTLKDGQAFLLCDSLGDLHGKQDGLFVKDTRILSCYELLVAEKRPSLLGAAITHDDVLFSCHLTNRPLPPLGERSLPKGVIHIERRRLLWQERMFEHIHLVNFDRAKAALPIRLRFGADFRDIFEVQGHLREQRGEHLPVELAGDAVRLSYRGVDRFVRTTEIRFSERPIEMSGTEAEFRIDLAAGATADLWIEIGSRSLETPGPERFAEAVAKATARMTKKLEQGAALSSSNRLLNLWVGRSHSDLALLTSVLPTGLYPLAGLPWFGTTFGRDGLITALQVLWLNPALARGVLSFLAESQARETSTFRDSEPGKILHEARSGEMAMLGEVPFERYYGGVDATPLFVVLAGAYEARTGDREFVDAIWPALSRAVAWIERRMDESALGFLDYHRGEETGLANQGWKDSEDSIFHADGSFPRGPIAVVEVQGYAYAALLAMAELAGRRDDADASDRWRSRAEQLKDAIERHFWMEDRQFYAIAMDGDARVCRVEGSNAGHLLFCGVPSAERAARVMERLTSPSFASGWGIRTLADDQARYNPMSYHNGSIWPHDTALCAAGLARYGGCAQNVSLFDEIFEAAHYFGMRMPELFCGFPRVRGQGPIPYPVACLPQAWAAGSVFMLLQACLGIRIDGLRSAVHIDHPILPSGVDTLKISGLVVGSSTIDLEFHRVNGAIVVVPTQTRGDRVPVLSHL